VTPRFQPSGESAVLVTLGSRIDLAVNQRVHALALRLQQARPAGLGEAVPAYCSLLVHYDPLQLDYSAAQALLARALRETERAPDTPARRVEIPVRYGGEHGLDLEFVARHCGLSQDEIVRAHTATDYRVYMMGFMPGFAYLGELEARLETPRLESPRLRVPAGSVGLAGRQTGIYPFESPGGWRLIGRTTLRPFDPERASPFLLAPGDLVRFVAVD
jgi:KipI family sensor histidine kinase inhibitor